MYEHCVEVYNRGFHGFHGAHHLPDVKIIIKPQTFQSILSSVQLQFLAVAMKLKEVLRELDVIKAFYTYCVSLRLTDQSCFDLLGLQVNDNDL